MEAVMKMLTIVPGALALLSLATAAAGPVLSQGGASSMDTSGAALYQKHCAVCHGPDGRGDGAWADVLAFRPADLTRISVRARGDFPVARVRAIIDGRKPVKGHLAGAMPVWGDRFRNPEDGYSEGAVRAKVSALAEYLRTIQAPPEDRQAGAAR
jgi:mono/diheme cytochrome c family protein